MAVFKVLLLLAAVAAASALQASNEGVQVGTGLTIQNQGAVGGFVSNAVKQVKEFVDKIKTRIVNAQRDLVKALEKTTETVLNRANAAIKKITGVDLNLPARWSSLENKVQQCAAATRPEVKELIDSIRTSAEECASVQVEDAKKIKEQLLTLGVILDTVPEGAIKAIKACGNSDNTTPAPEATTLAPEGTTEGTAEATTEGTAEATTEGTTNAPAARPQRLQFKFPDLTKAKCIAQEVVRAVQGMSSTPKLVYDLVKEIRNLTSTQSRNTVTACIATSMATKGPALQTSAAKLASCVIGPKQN